MISRPGLKEAVGRAMARNPVTALLGPRQSGKTTLARDLMGNTRAAFFDLEHPTDLAALENPMSALEPLRGRVVIDEVQRKPELFPILRVLADRPRTPARFLLLGSASPELVRGTSETLAGRIAFVEMTGFTLEEVGARKADALWLRGGFPKSFLAKSEEDSFAWRDDFVRTFLERDIPQLGISIPSLTLRRFWSMVAHFHGQIWNAAEFARSLGNSEPTARHYLDLLAGAFVLRVLPPWHENLSKRQVKSPKIYVRDSGLLHNLLGVRTRRDVLGHPKYGASWEGFAIEQVLSVLGPRDAYFWSTHSGAELDLLAFQKGRRLGFEFKTSESPSMTKSMHVALSDLKLDRLFVVYPGSKPFNLAPKVEALPITALTEVLNAKRRG
ncbi:MAG TPA: ATP-binding protein [Planctomycetota bacterium]|nr:ATP-binding protein [Planctomycetota bacterium]